MEPPLVAVALGHLQQEGLVLPAVPQGLEHLQQEVLVLPVVLPALAEPPLVVVSMHFRLS